MSWKSSFLVQFLLLTGAALHATTIINFENFSDSEIITDQIPGITFTNTIVLSAGISLNELDFPPHSGTNVASDNGGPISLTFDPSILGGSVTGLSGYFTYVEPVTVQAFDSANASLATDTSSFSNNTGTGGDPGSSPNEFLQVSSTTAISSISITGDPNGGSFVMDDLTIYVQPGGNPTVPEPTCFQLLLTGLVVLLCSPLCADARKRIALKL